MADIPVKTTLSNLIDYIWSSVLGTSSTKAPQDSTPKSATALYMCYPGIPVDPSTLDDMRDYSNPNGSTIPLEYFSNWVDKVPDLTQILWNPTDSKVSGGYNLTLAGANASESAGTFSDKQREKYDQSDGILWTEEPSLFPENPPANVHSANYDKYLQAQSHYDKAITDYNMKWNSFDMSNNKQQREWLAIASGLQKAIDHAWDSWVASHKNDIGNALAIMGSTLRNGIGTVINQQVQLFDQAQIPSVLGLSTPWYAVFTFPTKWWKDDAPGWMKIEIKSDMSYAHMEQHSQSFSGSMALFSFDAEGGYSSNRSEETEISSNVSISMEIAIIDLIRNWLNVDWMKSTAWFESDENAGKVSSGTIAGNNNEMFLPAIPNRLIVARNIVMEGSWSKKTSEEISQQIKAGASFGYGPFTISGKYEQGDDSKEVTSTFEDNKLTVDGIQIIGFLAACAPKAASMNDPGA